MATVASMTAEQLEAEGWAQWGRFDSWSAAVQAMESQGPGTHEFQVLGIGRGRVLVFKQKGR